MDERFEQEFYKSPWHRVQPVGPYGIQPYLRPARGQGGGPGWPGLRRAAAVFGPTIQQVVAFGRLAALRMAKRPMLLNAAPRGQGPSLRVAHREARPAAPRQTVPGSLHKAA